MSRKKRITWFVEHIAREMDVACIAKALLEDRYPVTVDVANLYMHAPRVLAAPDPDLVVHPFFYYADGALATQDYVAAWPGALHFNLAWEELFYGANARIKGPADAFARERVLHHAWGGFYRDYLAEHGVPAEHVFVNGNPTYQLYREPYRRGYPSRAELAARHGLDPEASWVLIPENYRWAFTDEAKLARLAATPEHLDELRGMKTHCLDSLTRLVDWCRTAAANGGVEIILRPRPATHTKHMLAFIAEHGGAPGARFHVNKQQTVREWILASDVVMSSFSTTLIEAAIADRPCAMVEPCPMPAGLLNDWYEHVERITDVDAFVAACRAGRERRNHEALAAWAGAKMLAHGDPIEGLVELVGRLARGDVRNPNRDAGGWLARRKGRATATLAKHRGQKIRVNEDTHEVDAFDEDDVLARTAHWGEVLACGAPADAPSSEPALTAG